METPVQLRCEHIMHGILIDEGVVEFKCRSRRCGAENGVVVLHRFDLHTGSLVKTLKFQDVSSKKENDK